MPRNSVSQRRVGLAELEPSDAPATESTAGSVGRSVAASDAIYLDQGKAERFWSIKLGLAP